MPDTRSGAVRHHSRMKGMIMDMKKYNTPKLDLIAVSDEDVITASPGTEAPRVEIDGGIWDLEIG